MAHVKAWYLFPNCTSTHSDLLNRRCLNNGFFHCGNAVGCHGYENSNRTTEWNGKIIPVLDDRCKHCDYENRYLERDYKSVEVEPHYAVYDALFGYYDLKAGSAVYECFFLEVDGHVVCDLRDKELSDG